MKLPPRRNKPRRLERYYVDGLHMGHPDVSVTHDGNTVSVTHGWTKTTVTVDGHGETENYLRAMVRLRKKLHEIRARSTRS